MSLRQKFRSRLQAGGTILNWVIARFPFDPAEVWPERRQLRVRGNINGFAFRTSLFGSRAQGYVLLVNKTMQRGADVAPGGIAEIVLEPDLENRRVATPPELDNLLRQSRNLRAWYGQLSESMRKAIAEGITQVYGIETRQK